MKTLLQHFFKPKWQHRDPQVRKQAIAALPAEEAELLAELARRDAVGEVRLTALRRLSDLALYAERARQDTEATVREFAQQRLRQLLEGGRTDSPTLAVRLSFVRTQSNDANLLEYLALQAQETELRALAIAQVNREATLVEAATRDPVHANRVAALARIQQPTALERVAKLMRTQDKQLYRHARDRLDALQATAAGQAQQQAEAQRLCERLESLGRSGRWEQESALQRAWHEQWQALNCTDTVMATRYYAAYQAYTQAYTRHCQERDARAGALIPIRTAKKEAYAALQAWVQTLPAVLEQSASVAEMLAAHTAHWQALATLPDDEEQVWQAQFHSWLQALQSRLAQAQQREIWQADHAAWQRQGQHLRHHATVLSETALQHWEAQAKKLRAQMPADLIFEGLEDQLAALRAKQQQQTQLRTQLLTDLPQQLDQLAQLLADGTLTQADKLHDSIRKQLQQLQQLGVGDKPLQAIQKQLHTLEPELRQLDAWRAWATDTVRERLIQDMQALVGNPMPPEALAKRVHELQAEWKKLSYSQGAQTLWTQFHEAAQQAYAPCQAHFAAQAARRQAAAETRAEFCDRLDLFIETTDWRQADWAAILEFSRECRNLWPTLGDTEREAHRKLQRRFQALLDKLLAPLEAERAQNLQFRRKLIGQTQALLNQNDIRASVSACRRLQQQWRVTVPGKREVEQQLWNQFRQACDAVFARRDQAAAERQAALASQQAARAAVITALSELTTTATPSQLLEAEAQAHHLDNQWAELPVVEDATGAATLDAQYRQAQTAWQQRLHELMLQRQAQRWQHWAELAASARQLETGLETPPDTDTLTAWQAHWEAQQAALEDLPARHAWTARITPTLAALQADAAQQAALAAQLRAQQAAALETLLRLEIAVGCESPPEYREARMQYQMTRLSRGFGLHQAPDDPETLLRTAHLLAVLPTELATDLAQRLATALQHWLTQTAVVPSRQHRHAQHRRRQPKASTSQDTSDA